MRARLCCLPLLAGLIAAAPDPLAALWTGTLLCTDAAGHDVGHLWLMPDGRFILFGAPVVGGSYARATAAGTICLHMSGTGSPGLADGACLAVAGHAIGDRWPSGIVGVDLTLLPGRR